MTATVPGTHRFARGVAQEPEIARIHAVLIQRVTAQIVRRSEIGNGILRLIARNRRRYVLRDEVATSIADPKRSALWIELGERHIALVLQGAAGAAHTIVQN